MSSNNQLFIHLECPICSDRITCGHSFCGPGQVCLSYMQQDAILKCAVCRADHQLGFKDLKPLYGIQDYFPSKPDNDDIEIEKKKCDKHKSPPVYWCLMCSIVICAECFRTDHKSHSVKNLNEATLWKLFESKFGKDLAGFLTIRRKKIEDVLAKISWETGKPLSTQSRTRKLVENLETKHALVELCLQRLNNRIDETKHNTDFLLTLLQMDVNASECVGYKHVSIQTDFSKSKVVGTGTQTERSTGLSVSTQTESFFSNSFVFTLYRGLKTIFFIQRVFLLVCSFVGQATCKTKRAFEKFWTQWRGNHGFHDPIFPYPYKLRIKQRNPMTFDAVFPIWYLCFEIRLKAMITSRKRSREKMLSIKIDCECTCKIDFKHARNIPVFLILANPENKSEFVGRKIVLNPFSRKQQIVEMVPHSELISSLKHWEKNGCYYGVLQVSPSDMW